MDVVDVIYYMIASGHAAPSAKWLGYGQGLNKVQVEAWWRMIMHPGDVSKADVLDLFFERGNNFRYFTIDRDGSAMPWPEIQELVMERRAESPTEVTIAMVARCEVENDANDGEGVDVNDASMQWTHLQGQDMEDRVVVGEEGADTAGEDGLDWIGLVY